MNELNILNDNYYNNIKNALIKNEVYKKVKDYSKNKSDLNTYYNVGKILSEAGKHYGESIIKKYSEKLVLEVGKKYNNTLLKRTRQFYWLIKKGAPIAHFLSWSHYVELLPIKDLNAINYYINLCFSQNLTRDELRAKIKSKEYDRLPESTKNKLVTQEKLEVNDLIKNPIIIKNTSNIDVNKISEFALKELIIDNIEDFMKELGNGYAFIGSEYKIKIGNEYNYIDLLLFNIIYNCYVVLELKVTELKKEYIGQIEVYMNYIDKNIKLLNQDKTIGIIIVKKNNNFVMENCSDERIISKEYKFI